MKGILDSGICPISGRTIELRPEWDFKFDQYSVRFGLLEPGFVLTEVKGYPTLEYLNLFYEILEAAIIEKNWSEFHTISDYSQLKSVTNTVREFNSERIKEFGRLRSINVMGASTGLKVNIHIGKFIHRHDLTVNLCRNYTEAFKKACASLSLHVAHQIPTESWLVETPNGRVNIELIGENILLSRAHGKADEVMINAYLDKLEEVLKWLKKINGSSIHYRILDASAIHHISMANRNKLAKGLHEIGKNYQVVNGYLVGRSFFVRLGFQIARSLLNHKVFLVDSVLEALKHIKSFDDKVEDVDGAFGEDHFWVSSLLNDLAQVDWSVPGNAFAVEDRILPKEWMPVYDAIEIIKSDVDYLISEREIRNLELTKEKERSNLLAENLKKTLQASEEMRDKIEKSMQVKEEFLANMSHEIRTPLNAIIGMNELISETTLNPDQADMIKTMRLASYNLMSLLNDILDLSKLEAGRLELEHYSFDIKSTLEDVYQLMKPKAEEKSISLELDIDQSDKKWVWGDGNRLRQVLINLVSNAIKFTEEGHVIIYLIDDENFGHTLLGVRDTGVGIDEQNLGNLFKAFSQEDASITRRFGGTGLGLAICKKITQLMGTQIEVSSQKGLGTDFSFRLKFKKAPPVVETVEVLSFDSAKSICVLLVEDNSVNQKVFVRLLMNLGIEVDVASNGEQGVNMALSAKYDMILMDLQMPVMDGLTATHKIRESESQPNIIVALTANALSAHRHQAKQVGMDDFLTKPLLRNDLVRCFNKWLATKNS